MSEQVYLVHDVIRFILIVIRLILFYQASVCNYVCFDCHKLYLVCRQVCFVCHQVYPSFLLYHHIFPVWRHICFVFHPRLFLSSCLVLFVVSFILLVIRLILLLVRLIPLFAFIRLFV